MNIFSNLLTTNAPTLKPYLAINNYSSFLNLFMNNELLCKDKLECRIVRDEAWVEWRIKDAPNKIEFIFFEYGTAFSIARMHNFEGLKRLNILYVSGNFGYNEIALCAGMVKWAKEEFFDLVWMVTDSEAIKKSLKMLFLLPAHKKLLFAYSASSHALNTSLESNPISLCGLDGDLDIYQAQDLHIQLKKGKPEIY